MLKQNIEIPRLIMDSALDAMICIDLDGLITMWTKQAEKIFGWKEEEVLGKTLTDTIIPQRHRESHRQGLANYVQSGNESVLNKMIEIEALNHDGNEFPVELTIVSIKENDFEFFCAFLRDISERKKVETELRNSELRYRSLINQVPDGVMITDMEGNFTDVNTRLCKMFGYSHEELLKMNAQDLIDPEELKVDPFRMDLIKQGNAVLRERRMIARDGTIIQVEANVKKFPDGRALAIARDITQRKKIQKELEQSHEHLRELSAHLETVREDERTQIARELHDELGQRLTGLKMDVSWLNKKISSDNKAVHEKISSMISLIDDTVKTIRHISSELRPGILDDLGLVDALEWQSSEFEKRTGVRCRFRAHTNEMSFSKNISTGIFRVYQETLTNVARHAEATAIKTTLEVNPDELIFKVSDNGKGFDESEIKDKKTLGLIGMRERAMMFGGTILIESSKGKGTSITLTVPAKFTFTETNSPS